MHGYRSKPHTPAAHLKKTAGSFGCSSPKIRTYRYWWYTYFCLLSLSLWFCYYHCYHHYNHYNHCIYLYTSGFQATARSVTNPRWIKVHVATRFDSKPKKNKISGPSYVTLWNMCWFKLTPWIDQKGSANSWQHIYIYMYIYIYVCVCLCG